MTDQNPPGLIAQVDQEVAAARHSVGEWVQNWRDAPATLTGQDKIVSLCQEVIKHDPQWITLWLAVAIEQLAEQGEFTLRDQVARLADLWGSRADTIAQASPCPDQQLRWENAGRLITYRLCADGLRAVLDGT